MTNNYNINGQRQNKNEFTFEGIPCLTEKKVTI